MFDDVEELRSRLAEVVAGLDADAVPLPAVDELWNGLDAIERLAGAGKTLLARRVEDAGGWRRRGRRSPAHDLAARGGTTVGRARSSIDTSKRAHRLPATEAAMRRGDLSQEQADAIADAASIAPGAEGELLGYAALESLGELRERCARVKAAARGRDGQHEANHRDRFCRRRTTADGAGEIVYRSTLDEVAEVWSEIQRHAQQVYDDARRTGDHESADAYAADGLLAMARHTASCGTDVIGDAEPDSAGGGAGPGGSAPQARRARRAPRVPAKIIYRIDWAAWMRGYPVGDEACEVAGLGPVPVSVVREMAGSGDAVLAAVVTKGVDVVSVAHLGRRPTAHQQTALEWRDPTCSRLGCPHSARLERDHRNDWADTHVTYLAWLDRLCSFDHDLKTRHGWSLVEGTGKRPMVPPGHPDHPGRRTDASDPARTPPSPSHAA